MIGPLDGGPEDVPQLRAKARWTAYLLPTIAVIGLVLLRTAPAQQPHPLSLDEILERLEHNLTQYDTTIPSFFCTEDVISGVVPGPKQKTITESTFRLKRVSQSGLNTALEESRTVKTVNGKPATSQDLTGPTVLKGAFEGGLAIVSLGQRACMNYKLERVKKTNQPAQYVIRFTTESHPPHPAECLLQESAKGQAFVDPVTLQITRLELTTPHHVITDDQVDGTTLKGERILSVDYAPVELDNRTFWMPVTITSRITAGGNTFHPTVWSFHALYRDYHKLEVTSRFLPVE